ncbi:MULTISPECIES: glycosyltransferase [unclassified Polaribacter]|uniref:glycosyltransferase n=1 Tax=unclassified Polaribacter TaxID=196858 RepID=UPI001C4E9044|nr:MULTISPECIES: glycosyltransferase [unclassified Polaribacter]QXP64631.1 glycosyltransferase [Polaribacter sp. HaHaR_3_91]QXP67128.1 glycosyltransferase [Polaribacter sp. AHE13PA]QXP69245.1 glycosyltransferase [Polaribacter sp. R2A056_3_33]
MKSILMISLHGYVGAHAELGKPDTGGQVVYVLELADRFSRLGKRVDLVTRQFEDQPEYDVVDDNFSVWRIPFGGKKFIRKEDMHDHLKKFVTNTLAAIKKENKKYDVVYSHYWDAGWAGQKIAEELGICHVHTPHSLGWWKQHSMGSDMDEKEMEKTYRFKERIRKEYFVYQMCNFVIATTLPQVDLLVQQYDVLSRNCSMIPPGIDENRFFPVPSKENDKIRLKYDIKPTDILALGRMAHNKGYDLLIRSLPTVFELCPEARLVAAIGGDSQQDRDGIDTLKVLAKELGVMDKIKWKNYIADEDLANVYRSASIFVMPSRYEPFGMVAIEAMACGTPSVITVHGGLCDLIDFGNQALFADPHRPKEFGAMMAMPLLYPKLRNEMSVEGARFARRNFGWTGIAKRMLSIFASSINQRTSETNIY